MSKTNDYITSNAYFLSDTNNDYVVALAPKYMKVGDKFKYENKTYVITNHREGSFFEIDQKITCNTGDMIEVTHKEDEQTRWE